MFCPIEKILSYADSERPGKRDYSARYYELLKLTCSRLVVARDVYGVIQQGDFETGPIDLDRPWVSKFTPAQPFHGSHMTSRNLRSFLGHSSKYVTSARWCEHDTLSDCKLDWLVKEMVSPTRRDRTFSMLSLNGDGRFAIPAWMERNSVASIAARQKCCHEPEPPNFRDFAQMCAAWTLTYSHLDFTSTGALVLVLEGEKYIAITAARLDTAKRLENWARLPYGYPDWFQDYAMGDDAPIYRIVLRAGDCVWIPPGWVHTVLTTEMAVQVGLNILPIDTLPRAISQWHREVQRAHTAATAVNATTPCTGKCQCEPSGSIADFPALILRYLRSQPTMAVSMAQTIKGEIVYWNDNRDWPAYLCFRCNPLELTLKWLTQAGGGTGKRRYRCSKSKAKRRVLAQLGAASTSD